MQAKKAMTCKLKQYPSTISAVAPVSRFLLIWVPVLTFFDDDQWCGNVSQINPLLPKLLWLWCFIVAIETLKNLETPESCSSKFLKKKKSMVLALKYNLFFSLIINSQRLKQISIFLHLELSMKYFYCWRNMPEYNCLFSQEWWCLPVKTAVGSLSWRIVKSRSDNIMISCLKQKNVVFFFHLISLEIFEESKYRILTKSQNGLRKLFPTLNI